MKYILKKFLALVGSVISLTLIAVPASQAAHQCQPTQVQTGTQQVQTGTKQVRTGTSYIPIYESQPIFSTVSVYETQPVYSSRYVPTEYGYRTVENGTKIIGTKWVTKREPNGAVTIYSHQNHWVKAGHVPPCYDTVPIVACGEHRSDGDVFKHHHLAEKTTMTYIEYDVLELVYGPAYKQERYVISAGHTEQYQSGTKQVKVGSEQVQTGTQNVRVRTETVPLYEDRPIYTTLPVYGIICTPIPDTATPTPVATSTPTPTPTPTPVATSTSTPTPTPTPTPTQVAVQSTNTLTYRSNGGSGSVPPLISANTGTKINLAGAGSLFRKDYTFTGWSTTPSGSTISSVVMNSNVTVYAVWVPQELIKVRPS